MPKISALPPMTTATADDEAPIVDDSVGDTKKFTLTVLKEWLQALVSWISTPMLAPMPYLFRAKLGTAQNTSAGSAVKVQFTNEVFDPNSNFDITTNKGRYTVPVTGYYQLNAVVNITTAGSLVCFTTLYVNGVEVSRGNQVATTAAQNSNAPLISALLYLTAGQYVEAYIFCNGTTAIDTGPTEFSGFLATKA